METAQPAMELAESFETYRRHMSNHRSMTGNMRGLGVWLMLLGLSAPAALADAGEHFATAPHQSLQSC